ncbi:MAG: hypothetical protein SGPRY_006099 [Prymnesium sp.]
MSPAIHHIAPCINPSSPPAIAGAAAVMSSEALLENPALFCSNIDPLSGAYLDQVELAMRYLQLCEVHPPSKGAAMMRPHLFKLLHNGLKSHTHLRDELLTCNTLPELRDLVRRLEVEEWEQPKFHTAGFKPEAAWYNRYRTYGEPTQARSREEIVDRALAKRVQKRKMKKIRRARARQHKSAAVLS